MAINTQNIGATITTVYTSSGDSALTFLSLCNHSGSALTCNIHIVPDGDSPTVDNLLIQDLEIIAGDTFILYHGGEKLILGNNDTVQVDATASNAVSAVVSYVGL